MAVAAGTRIGPYEVVALLGEGGMGEVYRARDPRLNRDVALKVLSDHVTLIPDRLDRFRREAQMLASLNHPNIGHIYGLERVETNAGGHALVLELVDGPTVADRLRHGPIPLAEALAIARQLAEALECAHEQGIIHRDLKPANIKVRHDGTVKVLDFGLAKALDRVADAQAPDAMTSPTLTAHATQHGLIIGTAAYMAPEQARGRAVDRRADIWAFGVVLYEMLSGVRPFGGNDISLTLASVLKDDVDWTALPADLPPPIIRLLRRSLEKDPKRRLSAIADARLELDDALANPEPALTRVVPHPSRWGVLPWAFGVLGLSAAVGAVVLWAPWNTPARTVAALLSVESGLPTAFGVGVVGSRAVISPAGDMLVLVADMGTAKPTNRTQLYMRRLNELQAVPLAGTEGAMAPFFRPDGQWIGFFANGQLKKVAIAGGAPVSLCEAKNGRGGWWGDDGTIIFTPDSPPGTVLHRVADTGGVSAPIAAAADITERWPQVLPGGRAVLYTANSSTTMNDWNRASVMVRPIEGGEPTVLVQGGFHGRYINSGHIVYVHEGTLFALPFDLSRLRVSGDAVPMAQEVDATTINGAANFSVSDNGTLVSIARTRSSGESPIQWLDASGKLSTLRATAANWRQPSFSQDGSRLALSVLAGRQSDLWIYEPERDLIKFTSEVGIASSPVWTPDGERIIFALARGGNHPNLYWRKADGTGPVHRLIESENPQIPHAVDPSGTYLAFTEADLATRADLDIKILPLEKDAAGGLKAGTPQTLVGTPAGENWPTISPDGRWLAYVLNEGGPWEIYVTSFPAGEGKWKVSGENGGQYPVWSKTRRELFYAAPAGPHATLMVTPYAIEGTSFRGDRARPWSTQPVSVRDRGYALHPDGKRMVVAAPDAADEQRSTVVLKFNIFDELRRKAAVQ